MGGGDARELGSHAQGAPCVVTEALGSSDSHATSAEVQIEKLIDLGLILEQYILAGYADICGSALDVDGDVAGLDPEVSHADFAVLALGQSDVEHSILRYVGLGCLSVHALEHIEIYGKADRLGTALHAVHELVVPAAGKGAVWHSVDEALENNAVIIDERMSDVLKVKKGDTLNLHIDDMPCSCKISAVTENYAGNFIYMTPECYETLTGKTIEYNVVLTTVSDTAKDIQHEMANDFMKYDDVVTVSLISEQVDAIMDTLNSLNIVVFVMIFCAGLLAMVVLYNLTNINIAERVREIATIKVLGFYSFETANYIYRENIVLTVAGAFAGLFMGNMLTGFIVSSIQMNNVMFPKLIGPLSYVWGFLLTLAFSTLVNFIMYFKMNKISMVESLKSIE